MNLDKVFEYGCGFLLTDLEKVTKTIAEKTKHGVQAEVEANRALACILCKKMLCFSYVTA